MSPPPNIFLDIILGLRESLMQCFQTPIFRSKLNSFQGSHSQNQSLASGKKGKGGVYM